MYEHSSHLLKQFVKAIMPYISHNVIHFMVTTTKTECKNKDFKEISGGIFAIFKGIWS